MRDLPLPGFHIDHVDRWRTRQPTLPPTPPICHPLATHWRDTRHPTHVTPFNDYKYGRLTFPYPPCIRRDAYWKVTSEGEKSFTKSPLNMCNFNSLVINTRSKRNNFQFWRHCFTVPGILNGASCESVLKSWRCRFFESTSALILLLYYYFDSVLNSTRYIMMSDIRHFL